MASEGVSSLAAISESPSIPCAASHASNVEGNCPEKGVKFCGGCQLVAYSSSVCQKAHWPQHKNDCKNKMNLDTWKPDWVAENRLPSFISDNPLQREFHGQVINNSLKYLWGNVPALDMLAVHANEGLEYKERLSLSFAACGDLRNVVKTVNTVPTACSAPLSIHVNDRDEDVIARSIALLILLFTGCSVECAAHVWFSAFITGDHVPQIDRCVIPLITDVVNKIVNKSQDQILAKTLNLLGCSLRIILQKWQWTRVLEILTRRPSLEVAKNSYKATVLHRMDHVQRKLYSEQGSKRLAKLRYRERGVLLPFGCTSDQHDQPNGTLFDNNSQWLQPDSADPLDGYWWEDVEQSLKSISKPANDLYGQLFVYICRQLQQFVSNCQIRVVDFTVTACDIQALMKYIPMHRFDRIEVSNVMDAVYLGPGRTLRSLTTLLRDTEHAAIIALFMNAVHIPQKTERMRVIGDLMLKAQKYCPIKALPSNTNDPEVSRRMMLGDLFSPYEDWFARYWQMFQIDGEISGLDFVVRQTNKVVPKWPWKFTEQGPIDQARARLLRLLSSGVVGGERYVEWVRKR